MPRVLFSHHLLALIGSLGLFFSFTSVQASDDKDRSSAGMRELGISETFGRWPDGIVEWQYNPTGEAAYYSDDAAFVALLQEAMTEIENVSGVDFQYMGINTGATILNFSDDIVTVGWADIGGASGVAGPASSCTGSEITAIGYCNYVDGSVRFNNDINDVDFDLGDPESSDAALVGVAMHEILHLLGLGHSDEPISIMYANPYTNLKHLRTDDIDGLMSLYGPSPTPADPDTYTAPAQNPAPVQVQTSYLANNLNITTPLATLTDAEAGSNLGVTWFEDNGDLPISMVVVGPQGYYKSKRVEDNVCAGTGCGWWWSAVSMDTLRTFPGTWTVHLIVDGGLDVTHTIDVQFTPPVVNQEPDSEISFDVVAGESPLTVNATLTINGDNEGDDVDATWHIPTMGETDVSFGTTPGQSFQQVTYTVDGDYEIYVEVTDDGSRYGTPGSGAEAGPGFRTLYRQVISVGPLPPAAPLEAIVSLGDINGNGISEVGVSIPGSTRVHIRDASTDALITDINFGNDDALQMMVLPDLDASGDPEIAMLNEQASGQVRVQIRDTITGGLVNNLWYGLQYEPVAMSQVADYSANGFPEIAVLGSEAGTDAVRVQLRDSASNAFVDNVFLGTQSIAHDVVSLADTSGNGVPELGILGVLKGSNQVRSQVWDADTAAFQSNVWFGNVYQPQSMTTMPDINSNGSDEIVAMGVDPATQNIRVQVRDSDTTATLFNIWLGAVNEAVDVAVINDINSDGVADLAVLLKTPAGTGRVRVQSGSNGTFIRNLFYAVVDDPVGLAVLPDYSANGFDELAVLGTSSGVRHVQILDTNTGTQVNRIDFP